MAVGPLPEACMVLILPPASPSLSLPAGAPAPSGDHPEDSEQHVAGRRPRADVRVEDRDVRTLLLHLVHDVEDIAGSIGRAFAGIYGATQHILSIQQ
jgi:hypothetical protein